MIQQKRFKNLSRVVLRVVLLAVAVSTASGAWASAWDVSVTLKRDTIEDAMIMPSALFIDESREQYYVVDSGKDRLLSFNREGDLLHVFKAGGALKKPFDMVRTSDGAIWVVEKERNSLTKIDLKAQETITNTLTYQGRTIYPHRLETDDKSLLYVHDKGSGDIFVYDDSLNEKGRITCDSCAQGFFDFKVIGNTVWGLDRLDKTVYTYSITGQKKSTIPMGDEVVYPVSLAVGPSGYLYVLDRHNRNIAVYDTGGEYKYSFLQQGIASGQLYYPVEIRFDPWEGLCVTDEGNARVEVFRR